MTTDNQFENLFADYRRLVAAGDDAGARAFLDAELQKMPEDMRHTFMMEILTGAVEQAADETEGR